MVEARRTNAKKERNSGEPRAPCLWAWLGWSDSANRKQKQTNKQHNRGSSQHIARMKTQIQPTPRSRGFTLIEMIGVLAVIAILAALLVPKIFEAINNARVNN